VVRAAAILLLAASVAGTQETPSDAAAKDALRKLADRLKEARTLSASVIQSRRSELLDKPITSSGRMFYRREPARLVFRLTEPRKAEIHMDKTSYQVYRPDEKRLERTDFGSEDISGKILMVFEPKAEEIGKSFAIRGGESKDGWIEVRLESTDEKVRKRLQTVLLTIAQADGALRRIAYTDGEADEVRFDLSEVAINPELAADLFTLKVPEGTRVLRRVLPQDK
jgi:outer membrane lipoprotein-sorting protein